MLKTWSGQALRSLFGQCLVESTSLFGVTNICVNAPVLFTLRMILVYSSRVVDALELVRKHEKLCSMDHLLGRIVALERMSELPSLPCLTNHSASEGGACRLADRLFCVPYERAGGTRVAKSRLNLMLRLPLSKSEESAMSSFFSDLGETTWLCHIIVHFLQSGRVDMAVPLADRLRRCKVRLVCYTFCFRYWNAAACRLECLLRSWYLFMGCSIPPLLFRAQLLGGHYCVEWCHRHRRNQQSERGAQQRMKN